MSKRFTITNRVTVSQLILIINYSSPDINAVVSGQRLLYSFIPSIYIAPLQGTYSEAILQYSKNTL